jgi:hypothetical protein
MDPEEPPHVESTLEPQSQRPHAGPASTTTPLHRLRPHWRIVLLVALVTLMLLAGSVVSAVQLLTPEATITLATTSQRVTTSIVHVVSGNSAHRRRRRTDHHRPGRNHSRRDDAHRRTSRVSAHAAITGPAGNIQAGDVYGPCCRLNVFAANGPFRGGQNARTYQIVTQQDINGVATHVKTNAAHVALPCFQRH